MNVQIDSTKDLLETSPSSVHFGQLVWAKLATAPFWPAVIFTEENQDWIRQKGKSTYVHVFFFGETAERSWIQTTRILPFLGMNKFSQQKLQWRRKMKIKTSEEQQLTLKDKSNLNIAVKQTEKLAKFSLRKRITVLKNEWWYWEDDDDVIPCDSKQENEKKHSKVSNVDPDQEMENKSMQEFFDSNQTDLDDVICLSDISTETTDIPLSVKKTSSVCFHPLTLDEEEIIIQEMIASPDSSFSACRLVAENEYLVFLQKNLLLASLISEHWFYLFVFRHGHRLARLFPRWINDMKEHIQRTPALPPMHISQIQSLIILFQHLSNDHQEQFSY